MVALLGQPGLGPCASWLRAVRVAAREGVTGAAGGRGCGRVTEPRDGFGGDADQETSAKGWGGGGGPRAESTPWEYRWRRMLRTTDGSVIKDKIRIWAPQEHSSGSTS